LSSGSLAGTQAVIGTLKKRAESPEWATNNIWTARTMFDVAMIVSDGVRHIEQRDGEHLAKGATPFNASFIIGGQIKGEPLRLFRTFAEGNFIEAGPETPFFQTGETKYGKPIIDRVINPKTTLSDAMKCVLVSFDSTMRSNLSVGMPIDLACCASGDLKLTARHNFAPGDAYFSALGNEWAEGVRTVFRHLPPVPGDKALAR
jgi:putative proteasome-type protease